MSEDQPKNNAATLAAIFPPFEQELAQIAQETLAQRIGALTLSDNSANAAATVYSRRLQHVEGLLNKAETAMEAQAEDLNTIRKALDAAKAEGAQANLGYATNTELWAEAAAREAAGHVEPHYRTTAPPGAEEELPPDAEPVPEGVTHVVEDL